MVITARIIQLIVGCIIIQLYGWAPFLLLTAWDLATSLKDQSYRNEVNEIHKTIQNILTNLQKLL